MREYLSASPIPVEIWKERTIEVNKQSVEALLGSGKSKPFVIPEYWKYPVVIYYVCYRNEENFETRFARFLNKLLMELMTKYLMIPTINAVKPDILKLNSAIVLQLVLV